MQDLSEIAEGFASIKPVSKLGNAAADLKDLQASMRGYLNNDTRKRRPPARLFVNPKRGFWGLSETGERRALEVLHQLGMVRGRVTFRADGRKHRNDAPELLKEWMIVSRERGRLPSKLTNAIALVTEHVVLSIRCTTGTSSPDPEESRFPEYRGTPDVL